MKLAKKGDMMFKVGVMLVLLVLVSSCVLSPPVGKLTGTIHLEYQTDYSGIIVAIYDLVELNSEIVSINQKYPQIGIQINQHTEFDHRLQSPLYQTTTNSSGNFTFENVPVGEYNIVAIKDDFGFRYITEFSINDGDNHLHSIELYEEVQIYNGEIIEDIEILPYHHLVLGIDTNVAPPVNFVIHPNAVVRIAPNSSLSIYGSLKMQGKQDSMFWITTNDGFSEEMIHYDNLSRYGQVILYAQNIENNVIDWGKFGWANIGLFSDEVESLAKIENVIMGNVRHGTVINGGVDGLISFEFTNNIIESSSENLYNNFNSENVEEIICKNNIIINGWRGLQLKESGVVQIYNNYFSKSGTAFEISHMNSDSSQNMSCEISHNEIHNDGKGISFDDFEFGMIDANIEYNDIFSDVCIYIHKSYTHVFFEIHKNNLNYNDNQANYSIHGAYGSQNDIDASENCFIHVGSILTNEDMVANSIWDENDNNEYYWYPNVNYSNFLQKLETDAGIE
jgi:hypothetical protein